MILIHPLVPFVAFVPFVVSAPCLNFYTGQIAKGAKKGRKRRALPVLFDVS